MRIGREVKTLVQDHVDEVPDLFFHRILGFDGDGIGSGSVFFRKFIFYDQLLVEEIQVCMAVFLINKACRFMLFRISITGNIRNTAVIEFEPAMDDARKAEQVRGKDRACLFHPGRIQIKDSIQALDQGLYDQVGQVF